MSFRIDSSHSISPGPENHPINAASSPQVGEQSTPKRRLKFSGSCLLVDDSRSSPHSLTGGSAAAAIRGVERVASPKITCLRELSPETTRVFRAAWMNADTAIQMPGKGVNGSYLIRDKDGRALVIFKPLDEERGAVNCPKKSTQIDQSKWGVQIGTQGAREAIAYLLDQKIGAGVPPTVMMTLASAAFHGEEKVKRGSAQQMIPNSRNLHQIDYDELNERLSCIPDEFLQKLFLMDLITANPDRNRGNLMLDEGNHLGLIDHGCILPSEFLDRGDFTWIGWDVPALKNPFIPQIRTTLQSLDYEEVRAVIVKGFPDFPASSLQTLKHSLVAVKLCAEERLSPYQTAALFMAKNESLSLSPIRVFLEHAKTQRNPDEAFVGHLTDAIKKIQGAGDVSAIELSDVLGDELVQTPPLDFAFF